MCSLFICTLLCGVANTPAFTLSGEPLTPKLREIATGRNDLSDGRKDDASPRPRVKDAQPRPGKKRRAEKKHDPSVWADELQGMLTRSCNASSRVPSGRRKYCEWSVRKSWCFSRHKLLADVTQVLTLYSRCRRAAHTIGAVRTRWIRGHD